MIVELLTHLISSSENKRPVITMRKGMVRISINGSARDAGLDFTIQRITRQPHWMSVNTCIRAVLTYVKNTFTSVTLALDINVLTCKHNIFGE